MIELGRNPRIGDLQPSQALPERYFPCDIRKADTLREVLSGAGAIINLAAEHRDDVRPISRYHETNVEGACQVAGPTQEKLQIALKMIADLTQTAEVGKTYLGKVAKVVEFGAFVTILPGLDGLLPPATHALPGISGHVSELAHHRVANPADEVSEGLEIMVKCIGIDEKSGKVKLSRKALIPKPEGADAKPEGDAPNGEDRPRERRPRPRR